MSYSNLRNRKSRTAKLPLAALIAAVFITAFSTPAMAGSYGDTSDPFDAAPSDNVDLPYAPAAANADFSVPYSDALGSGGQSWRGLLTGTMQTTAPCVTYNQATQAGGSATTTGSIAVYKSASEVSNALSVSGSAGYRGVAKLRFLQALVVALVSHQTQFMPWPRFIRIWAWSIWGNSPSCRELMSSLLR